MPSGGCKVSATPLVKMPEAGATTGGASAGVAPMLLIQAAKVCTALLSIKFLARLGILIAGFTVFIRA